ncbi:CCA tRNA nucleotidyltransferase [bacterium]|nr:CCA tRNA nucleotidyltransferase [bacterium]
MPSPTHPSIPLYPAPLFDTVARHAAALGVDVHLVGGYVRDALLGRPSLDADLITSGDPEPLGRAIAKALAGHFVVLDPDFGVARVVLADGVVLDLARLQGETIEEDLSRRDLSINAIALPLVRGSEVLVDAPLLDPTGGLADLEARTVRAVSLENLIADPVRLIRVLRFAATLDFAIAFETLEWVETYKRKLLEAAYERTTAELLKILVLPDAYRWIERLFGLGILGVLTPEFTMLRRVPILEGRWLDGLAHALTRTRRLEAIVNALQTRWPAHAQAIREDLEASLGAGSTRGALVKLAALLLDIGRPFTLAYDPDGALTFEGHETEGGARIGTIAERLKLSAKAREFMEKLVRYQTAPLALDAADPVALYRLFRSAGDSSVALLLVAMADRETALGRRDPELEGRLERAFAGYFRADQMLTKPQRLLDGQGLMGALGVKPGKHVGVLLEQVLEAQLRGEIASRDEAIALAQRLHQG